MDKTEEEESPGRQQGSKAALKFVKCNSKKILEDLGVLGFDHVVEPWEASKSGMTGKSLIWEASSSKLVSPAEGGSCRLWHQLSGGLGLNWSAGHEWRGRMTSGL